MCGEGRECQIGISHLTLKGRGFEWEWLKACLIGEEWLLGFSQSRDTVFAYK